MISSRADRFPHSNGVPQFPAPQPGILVFFQPAKGKRCRCFLSACQHLLCLGILCFQYTIGTVRIISQVLKGRLGSFVISILQLCQSILVL